MIDGIGFAASLWHPFPVEYISADDGVQVPIVNQALMTELGWWDYHPFRPPERFALRRLPAGRIIVVLHSRHHLCAVIDGVVHDIDDCSKGGRATMAGYLTPRPPPIWRP